MKLTNESSQKVKNYEIVMLDLPEFNTVIEAFIEGSDFFIPKQDRNGFNLEYETQINNEKKTIVLN